MNVYTKQKQTHRKQICGYQTRGEERQSRSMGSTVQTAAAAAKSLQSCPTLCDPVDGSPQGSLSLGFSRQEHWSGLPFPSPRTVQTTIHKIDKQQVYTG